jgi:ribosomal protein S18 acetylase RimI-like enzyme
MVLSEFLKDCDRSNRAVQLEYLKWNPVGSLYKRHGFEVVSENKIHYFMVREPR